MDSITQILNSINAFSKSIFHFTKLIEPLMLLKKVPLNIATLLNSNDFIYHLKEATSHISWLVEYINSNIANPLKKEVKRLKKYNNKDNKIPYADFTVDLPPIFSHVSPIKIERSNKLDYQDILTKARNTGTPIFPINRKNPELFSFEGICPFCGAPREYIYDNSKGKGQLLCKLCHNTFSLKTNISNDIGIYCPYCNHKLDLKHDRKGYNVYHCPNNKCSYYKDKKKQFKEGSEADRKALMTSSKQFRFRYHYRDFKFNLDTLSEMDKTIDGPIGLSRIHFDQKVLGLALTYYVNYGLSSRKVALILREVHGLKISHQTIINYASTVSKAIKPLVDNYKYDLGNTLVGDETYIKVRGKNNYAFFWSEPLKKIITSYTIYSIRDTKCACKSIHDNFRHYKEIPDDLLLVTDGNPIYNAAQLFFDINGIKFDLQQVIGVKNQDEVSKQYRPYKQIEERLNRTYKQNYYGTNGYDKLEGANSYMVLFVCFFNFLRGHSSLNYKTPVETDWFDDDTLMHDKWLKILDESFTYYLAYGI